MTRSLREAVDLPVVHETPPPSAPVRMCIGCRQRALAADLIRVVAVTGPELTSQVTASRVVVDRHRDIPGRGAWLHPRNDCVAAAVRRKAFASALKVVGIHVDQNTIEAAFAPIAEEQVAEDMSTP